MSLLDSLLEERIVAILRKVPSNKIIPTVQALSDGGIKLLEITMNSEKALESIYETRQIYDQNEIFIGAGTVLNLKMARDAIEAGAQFLISPNLDLSVISYAIERNIEIWPGVMTPTEIVNAWNAGVNAVKLYPADKLGSQYIKDIKAPLDNIPIIATGGINIENLEMYFKAGTDAVGVGGQLVQQGMIENNRFEDLKKLAEKFVEIAAYGRSPL